MPGKLYCTFMSLEQVCFILFLKLKAMLKTFCSMQMSQKSLENKEFTHDECLPKFYLNLTS